MRSFFFRWLVVLLTCVAVPVQGFAAVANCGPVHHGNGFAAPAADGDHDHASHAGADASHHGDLSAADTAGSAGITQCGTCAACCAGSLMAAPNFRSVADLGSYEFIAFPPLVVSSAKPDAIDRPPPFPIS